MDWQPPDDLKPFGALFSIARTPLHEDIGLRCYFTAAKQKMRYTIVAVQKIYNGELAYRVVPDDNPSGWGCPALPDEVTFVPSDKTYKATFGTDSKYPESCYFDNDWDATDWITAHYIKSAADIMPGATCVEFSGKADVWDGFREVRKIVRSEITWEIV